MNFLEEYLNTLKSVEDLTAPTMISTSNAVDLLLPSSSPFFDNVAQDHSAYYLEQENTPMISGVTIKHYMYCPAIVRITELGFQERVSEAMIEGSNLDRDVVERFLYAQMKAKEILRKPVFRYGELVGSPDFVLRFSLYYSPLDVKNSRKINLDHKVQVLYYAYLMDMLGFRVKESALYYIPEGKILRMSYGDGERRYVERIVEAVRRAREGELRVRQPAWKCENCGFFQFCKPRRVGKFYEREF